MLNQKYYWGTIRKAIIAFGNLFNNIIIDRRDETGTIIQSIKVPLSYAPRQKFIARIEQEPNDPEQDFQVLLPRLGFEITGVTYDATRKLSLLQQNRINNATSTTLNAQLVPTPYNLDINLYAYVKNQDDGLQIVEQILPVFNPDYNLTYNVMPDLDIKNDLPVILNSVSFEDDYEGDFKNRRMIIWTFSFTVKVNLFGPINKQKLIRKVTTNVGNVKQSAQITPSTARPGEEFEIVDTFEGFE